MAERTKKSKGADEAQALRARLENMPAAEVRRPNHDLPAYLAWGTALATAAKDHEPALLATPMTPEADLTAAELAEFGHVVALLDALQDEQERRQQATANLTPAQKKDYGAARAEEKAVVDAIRHAYRDDAAVRGWCAQVLRGEGVADLHDDARKLAAFWAERADHLARFTDAKAALGRLVALAAKLPEVATPDAEDDKRHTRLRNAAWTVADRIGRRIRVAGRFALRGDAEQRRRFLRAPEKPARKAAKAG